MATTRKYFDFDNRLFIVALEVKSVCTSGVCFIKLEII
jgi:hypothetical protein